MVLYSAHAQAGRLHTTWPPLGDPRACARQILSQIDIGRLSFPKHCCKSFFFFESFLKSFTFSNTLQLFIGHRLE